MKVTLQRERMVIVPEGAPDELYLEQVLGIGAVGCEIKVIPPAKGSPPGTGGVVTLSAVKPSPPSEATEGVPSG